MCYRGSMGGGSGGWVVVMTGLKGCGSQGRRNGDSRKLRWILYLRDKES